MHSFHGSDVMYPQPDLRTSSGALPLNTTIFPPKITGTASDAHDQGKFANKHPQSHKAAICDHVDCGYGTCVADADGRDYQCVCNECFEQTIEEGSNAKRCTRVNDAFHPEKCSLLHVCDPNPCECGGECVPIAGPAAAASASGSAAAIPSQLYTCKCPAHFGGINCDRLTCPQGQEAFTRWEGDTCGICINRLKDRIDPCGKADGTGNPCKNGGQCEVDGASWDGFVCKCLWTNFTGKTCEDPIAKKQDTDSKDGKSTTFDPCAENPCQNGGACRETRSINADRSAGGDAAGSIKDWTCECRAGWTGRLCEVDVNPCRSSYRNSMTGVVSTGPCPDEYQCINDASVAKGYYCQCPHCAGNDLTASEETDSVQVAGGAGILETGVDVEKRTGGLWSRRRLSLFDTLAQHRENARRRRHEARGRRLDYDSKKHWGKEISGIGQENAVIEQKIV